jgi:hypothetical protein
LIGASVFFQIVQGSYDPDAQNAVRHYCSFSTGGFHHFLLQAFLVHALGDVASACSNALLVHAIGADNLSTHQDKSDVVVMMM